jgi:biopolymer transport protein ExbD
MRSPTNLGRGSIGFNMTPMIDVVFLLIIFFLVSSHLARQETQVAVDLPDATSSDRPEEEDVRLLIVNILSETEILVGSQPIEPARLETLLDYESRKSLGTGAARPLEVRIRTDRTVPYQAVEPILLACARSGIWNVKFAVVSNEQ